MGHTVEEDVVVTYPGSTSKHVIHRAGEEISDRRAVKLGLLDAPTDGVPDGSAGDVLAWVDGDVGRAAEAVTCFTDDDGNPVDGRKSLVDDLRKITGET